ncbi:MAG: hypothetical protein QMD36_05730 [Candidatus Aenigmarchaeota archaeon]|nr:hypothetical protein [Candidatus Aenigmarchaeota archaeon]
MRRVVKIASIFLIYLAAYPLYAPFFKDYVVAQPIGEPAEATCDAARNWELTWRPKIIYCKNPLRYKNDAEGIDEYRYFIYAHKPDTYANVVLYFSGLPSYMRINNLTENVAHWDDSSHISIDNSGAFYFASSCNQGSREDCENNGCGWCGCEEWKEGIGRVVCHKDKPMSECSGMWWCGYERSFQCGYRWVGCEYSRRQITFSSSDPRVMTIPIENCNETVVLSAILFEEGRFGVPGSEVNKDFLNLVGYLIAMTGFVFPADFNGKLPGDVNLQIARYLQQAGDVERRGFLLVIDLDNKVKEFVPLKGTTEYVDQVYFKWNPSVEALAAMRKYWEGVKSGKYKNIILGLTLPPISERSHEFLKRGIDLHFLPISRPEDFEQLLSLQNSIFNGQKIPYLYVTSTSLDALDQYIKSGKGNLYTFFFELDPRNIPIKTITDSRRELVHEIFYYASLHPRNDQTSLPHLKKFTSLSFLDWDPRDVMLQNPITVMRSEITPDGKIFLRSIGTNPEFSKLISIQNANRLGQNFLWWIYDDWIDFVKPDLTKDYKKELATNALEYDIPAYKAIVESMDEGPTKNNFKSIVDKHELALKTAVEYFHGKKTLAEAKGAFYESMGTAEELLAKEGIIQIGIADEIGASLGQLPWEEAKEYADEAKKYADEAAKRAMDSGDETLKSLESEFTKKIGETIKAPSKFTRAKTIAKEVVRDLVSKKGLVLGFIFSVAAVGAPYLIKYGEAHEIYWIAAVGRGIQIVGLGLTVVWAASLAWAGLQAALVSSTVFVTWIWATLVSQVVSFLVGFLIGLIVIIILSTLWCMFWAPPGSPECGCNVDPAYGKPRLKLDKKAVSKDETLKYIVYGLLYCYPPTPPNYFVRLEYKDDLQKPTVEGGVGGVKDSSDHRWITYPLDACVSLDGRCFECSVNVTEPKEGSIYYVSGSYEDYSGSYEDYGGEIYTYHTLGRTDWQYSLKVCPAGYVADASSDKCVSCDSSHIETSAFFGDIPDNTCESACGASPECDEISPEDISSCDRIGYTYFQNSCSDCLAEDKDNVCRSPGSLGPNDGCTASEECNGTVVGTSWCKGGIRKTCDPACTFSQWCDSSCPDWNGDINCYGLEPGKGCCFGCYYVDVDGNRKVDIIDIAKVAMAYGSYPGHPRWNPNADVDNSAYVDIIDINKVASKYGQRC